ncbi:MAG: hypothetical protein HRU19_16580 [Pseudobacteriovorax sp.]|nr:hypothetical protein [Pseudobacteriovorax sp.]
MKIFRVIGIVLASATILSGCAIFEASDTASEPQSSGRTSILMEAQPVFGVVIRPYTGTFGPLRGAQVDKISVPGAAQVFIVNFVKNDFSLKDCGNPKAVVRVGQGGETTPEQLKEIFGTSNPTGQVLIRACITSSDPVDRFFLNINWSRPNSNANLALSQNISNVSSVGLAAKSNKIIGKGGCINTSDRKPVVEDGLFKCDLQGEVSQLEGLGILSSIASNGRIKTKIEWDVFEILFSIDENEMKFPKIKATITAESQSGRKIDGTMVLEPTVSFEGDDLCQVEFKDIALNFEEINSPQLSSFLTRSAGIALENNETLNRLLTKVVSDGFINYIPDLLACEK